MQQSDNNDRQSHAKHELKPGALLAPLPVVLLSCCGHPDQSAAQPNLITVAWAGMVCSSPPMVSVSIRPERYSYQLIEETGEFVINLVDRQLLNATDFCGVRSGRDIDKFAACSLTPLALKSMRWTPAVAESPLHLGCTVRQRITLGSHVCYIAEIITVEVNPNLIDKKGRLCLEKADLIAYQHGQYYSLGNPEGFFGFSVASPAVFKQRMKKMNLQSKRSD
ncbi:MAG: flavin reductase family protein [Clostridiaceae bacterium]|jgi:flavin reductase (DIM6/NTAB) family NADH-FMN oxidoreductase RutF|nr:flavin reductase family protein [Eubacteriales bacterium]NLV47302.1 flavin reductase family protein [Clostridiaceae bacterium]